jgi:hypothetical protein
MSDKLLVDWIDIPGEFGISVRCPIWNDSIDISEDIRNDFISNVEKFYTQLDLWKNYNLFNIQHPFVDALLEKIITSYKNFCLEYKVEPKKELWVNGWMNLMKEGMDLPIHCHSTHKNSYLSGVYILTQNDSSTKFFTPQLQNMHEYGYGIVDVKNKIGQLIIFPQWLFHRVETVKEQKRYTIGFDLHTPEAIDYYTQQNNKEKLPIGNSIRII